MHGFPNPGNSYDYSVLVFVESKSWIPAASEREFAYRGKPNPDQAAGIYCSVCNAHDKFCRWTRNLDFYMFSKRPQSNIFPSRTFLLYNIILVSKLNAIVSVERE